MSHYIVTPGALSPTRQQQNIWVLMHFICVDKMNEGIERTFIMHVPSVGGFRYV